MCRLLVVSAMLLAMAGICSESSNKLRAGEYKDKKICDVKTCKDFSWAVNTTLCPNATCGWPDNTTPAAWCTGTYPPGTQCWVPDITVFDTCSKGKCSVDPDTSCLVRNEHCASNGP